MAEQIFVGDGSFEDATDGEEVFAGTALFSEEAAAGGDPEGSLIHGKLLNGLLTRGVLVG